jgi:hypothetical protein
MMNPGNVRTGGVGLRDDVEAVSAEPIRTAGNLEILELIMPSGSADAVSRSSR